MNMKEFIRKVLKEEGLEWAEQTPARPPLDFTTKTIHYVDYHDLERFIESYYGDLIDWDFSIPAELESSNDVTHELSAYANEEPWEKEEFEAWKRGEKPESEDWRGRMRPYHPGVHDLLNDLAKEGVLPEGEWFVRVSW